MEVDWPVDWLPPNHIAIGWSVDPSCGLSHAHIQVVVTTIAENFRLKSRSSNVFRIIYFLKDGVGFDSHLLFKRRWGGI